MYSESTTEPIFSPSIPIRSKTRTLHSSTDKYEKYDKISKNTLYMSQELEKIEKEALTRRIFLLSEENQRFKEQIEGFDHEFERFLKVKAEEIEGLQMEKMDIELELRGLKEKNVEFSNEINEKNEEIERLLRNNETLNHEIDKQKNVNNSLNVRYERTQSNSLQINKELENKSQIIQENFTKKVAEMKIFYKKKQKSFKNELKFMKNIAKDLEISEEKRLEIYKEFEAFKVKVHEEQTHLSSEHCDQMKRLEELSYSKLNEFENQLELKLRTENDTLSNKYRILQEENQELLDKTLEKERFYMLYKENSEKDFETLHKALESLQKSNEIQRKKSHEQQEKFNGELNRKQKEIEGVLQENQGIREESEEKTRLSREELQRLVGRLGEKQEEISNLRGILSQKIQELEGNFAKNQFLQEKLLENNRVLSEKEALLKENLQNNKLIETQKNTIKQQETRILTLETTISEQKDHFQRVSDEKSTNISSLNKSLEALEMRFSHAKSEISRLETAKLQGNSSLKAIDSEKIQALNKVLELQGALKAQEKKNKEEISEINKEFEGRITNEIRKKGEIELKIKGFEMRENELKGVLEEKNIKLRVLQGKSQKLKEKCLQSLRFVEKCMKDLKSMLNGLNQGFFESFAMELQEKLIGLSSNFTRKLAFERQRIEGFYSEERAKLKEKHQRENEELMMKIKEKDGKIQRISEEKMKKDQGFIKELEGSNKVLASELMKIKGILKEKEREFEKMKGFLEKGGKKSIEIKEYKVKIEELEGKIENLEEFRSKDKEKACKDLLNLRGEIDELYKKNKHIFNEFTMNITSLRENQEQELRNINVNYDEIIEVLKEKVRFYEENGHLFGKDDSENINLNNQDFEKQKNVIKSFYQEQIALFEHKNNQILFQNTMEMDKNLRNLCVKAQEIERLEQKIKDLETILKAKNIQIEELSTQNSLFSGKLRNLEFQIELKNNYLNMKPLQISEEILKYKEEMLENPSLIPSNSFKSKHYSKVSLMGNNPLTNIEEKSDVFYKRINELKQLSKSISTNPLNTYKELPIDDEKKGDGGITGAGNLHKYSKSSSNFLQYANKLVEKKNGFTSHRDKSEENKTILHKSNQKSCLI